MDILSVSQLNRYVKSRLDEDFRLRDLFLQGEISNLKRHMSSGHIYFTIKDDRAAIQAVMWRSAVSNLMFEPTNGMSVIVRCTVSLYEASGSYQIYVNDMQPNGVGQLYIAYKQSVERLSALGLFDEAYKKKLPQFPENVVVITSPTGAVINDIINVASRRYPCCNLIIAPCNVQGKGAALTIIDAIKNVDKREIADVIIIARGGGSLEDLWEYNNEELAKAIFSCETPVVSGVGHETDFTICDMVADLRAPTPSAAAELVFPQINDVKYSICNRKRTIDESVSNIIKSCSDDVSKLESSYGISRFEEYVDTQKSVVSDIAKSITKSMHDVILRKQECLDLRTKIVEEQSPIRLLSRGYSVTKLGKTVITSSLQLKKGDEIVTRFLDGNVKSKVL